MFTKILRYARHCARPTTHEDEDELNPYNHLGMKPEGIPIFPPEKQSTSCLSKIRGKNQDAQGRGTNFLTLASVWGGGGGYKGCFHQSWQEKQGTPKGLTEGTEMKGLLTEL